MMEVQAEFTSRRSGPHWPPQCCVPAFVHATLTAAGFEPPDPASLSRDLGVKVGPSDANPFGLGVANDPTDRGVRPEHATGRIEAVLRACAPALSFRHVRFSTITFGLYEEVLAQAVARECSVAVGLDPHCVGASAVPGCRHVMRIVGGSGKVKLIDDSAPGSVSTVEAGWPTVETAVHSVHDGYWIIGRAANLDLDFCLPWERGV